MPTCQSEKSVFIAFFSRTGVLGRAMHSPGSHPSFCLLFRKTADGRREWQIAKDAISSDIGLFSAAEASMEFLAELVDRWFRSGIVHLDVKTREGFMWRGR